MLVRNWTEFDLNQIPDDDECLADLETFNAKFLQQSNSIGFNMIQSAITLESTEILTFKGKDQKQLRVKSKEENSKEVQVNFSLRKYLHRIGMVMFTKKKLKEVKIF